MQNLNTPTLVSGLVLDETDFDAILRDPWPPEGVQPLAKAPRIEIGPGERLDEIRRIARRGGVVMLIAIASAIAAGLLAWGQR